MNVELGSVKQPPMATIEEAFNAWWQTMDPEKIATAVGINVLENPGGMERLKILCFTAMASGVDWGLSQPPRALLITLERLKRDYAHMTRAE